MSILYKTSLTCRFTELLYLDHESVLPEQPGISCQSSYGDANVVVNMENLLLVGSQFRLGSLKNQNVTHQSWLHVFLGPRYVVIYNEYHLKSYIEHQM